MSKSSRSGGHAHSPKRNGLRINRRNFMAGSAAIGGTVLAAPWVRRARAADDEITIFTWETYHEPPWVKE